MLLGVTKKRNQIFSVQKCRFYSAEKYIMVLFSEKSYRFVFAREPFSMTERIHIPFVHRYLVRYVFAQGFIYYNLTTSYL